MPGEREQSSVGHDGARLGIVIGHQRASIVEQHLFRHAAEGRGTRSRARRTSSRSWRTASGAALMSGLYREHGAAPKAFVAATNATANLRQSGLRYVPL